MKEKKEKVCLSSVLFQVGKFVTISVIAGIENIMFNLKNKKNSRLVNLLSLGKIRWENILLLRFETFFHRQCQ